MAPSGRRPVLMPAWPPPEDGTMLRHLLLVRHEEQGITSSLRQPSLIEKLINDWLSTEENPNN